MCKSLGFLVGVLITLSSLAHAQADEPAKDSSPVDAYDAYARAQESRAQDLQNVPDGFAKRHETSLTARPRVDVQSISFELENNWACVALSSAEVRCTDQVTKISTRYTTLDDENAWLGRGAVETSERSL